MTQSLDTNANLEDSLAWIIEHAGFPTFDQFRKNPELLRGKKDELFASIDQNFNPFGVYKHKYFWRGIYEADSLEKIQKMAQEDGYAGDELEMRVMADRKLGDPNDYDKKITVRVEIYPKEEMRSMGGIVAND